MRLVPKLFKIEDLFDPDEESVLPVPDPNDALALEQLLDDQDTWDLAKDVTV